MIQFEQVIEEESIKICEQLDSYALKKSTDFGAGKPLKRETVAIQGILLIIIALTIYRFFTLLYNLHQR